MDIADQFQKIIILLAKNGLVPVLKKAVRAAVPEKASTIRIRMGSTGHYHLVIVLSYPGHVRLVKRKPASGAIFFFTEKL